MTNRKCSNCGNKTVHNPSNKYNEGFWEKLVEIWEKYHITLCKKCRDDLTIKELNEMVKKKYGKCKK